MPAFIRRTSPIGWTLSSIHSCSGTLGLWAILSTDVHEFGILKIQVTFATPIFTGTTDILLPLKFRNWCFLYHTYLVQSKLYVVNFDVIPLRMSGFDLLGERIPIQGTCHKVQTGTGSAVSTTHCVVEFYCYSCHLDLLLVLEMRHCNALFVFSCHFSET